MDPLYDPRTLANLRPSSSEESEEDELPSLPPPTGGAIQQQQQQFQQSKGAPALKPRGAGSLRGGPAMRNRPAGANTVPRGMKLQDAMQAHGLAPPPLPPTSGRRGSLPNNSNNINNNTSQALPPPPPRRRSARGTPLPAVPPPKPNRSSRRAGGPICPHGVQNQPWFHGPISRQVAEQRLARTPPGVFLVRKSASVQGFVISLKVPQDVAHVKIAFSSGGLCTGDRTFPTFHELFIFYREMTLHSNQTLLCGLPVNKPAARR